MSSLFRLVACLAPNMVVANSMGGLTLLLLVVNSGFVIVRNSIPGWWIWAYWLSPFAHSLRILVVNEFTSPRWSTKLSSMVSQLEGKPGIVKLLSAIVHDFYAIFYIVDRY